jgi:hypothetical protein
MSALSGSRDRLSEFCLAIEQEVTDVAILHHVLFALDTQLASSPDFLFAGERFEIFE